MDLLDSPPPRVIVTPVGMREGPRFPPFGRRPPHGIMRHVSSVDHNYKFLIVFGNVRPEMLFSLPRESMCGHVPTNAFSFRFGSLAPDGALACARMCW